MTEENTSVNPDEEPVFDWANISHRWARNFARISSQAVNDALIAQSRVDENASPAEKHKFRVAQAAALEGMNDSADKHDEMLAKIIVSVPRSWLVDGAAEGLTGLDLIDAVRQDKISGIMTAYHRQQQTIRTEIKN
jgi:hypothetical protein